MDEPVVTTINRTLLDAASTLDAIVVRLGVTLSPVSFLGDIPADSRPTSAAGCSDGVGMSGTCSSQPPSASADAGHRTLSDPAAVRAASSLVIDGILATGVRNAEVAATMEELRAIAVRLQSAAAAVLRVGGSELDPQRPQRLLSIVGDADRNAASTSALASGGGADVRYASAMSSMSHIQPLGATMGGSRTPHRGEAFRDVGDTDVQQWLNENYSHQAKREANGFELTLSRRVESISVPGEDGGETLEDDEDCVSDTEVTIGQPQASLSPSGDVGAAVATVSSEPPQQPVATKEAQNSASFLIPVVSIASDAAAAGSPAEDSPAATTKPGMEVASVAASSSTAAPSTTAAAPSSSASRKLSTNVISPSAAAALLKRQGSTATEASVRMTYTRSEKRSFPATTSGRRLVEMLEVWSIPVMEGINTTEFDIFVAHETYGTNLLLYTAANIFLQYNFVRSLQLDVKKMLTFFETVRYFYRDENPYHNSIHAADVLQTTHVYLCVNDVKENFSDVELLAVLFAALVHDVGHLGIANAFLCKIRHPFARIFNDASPLENTHASVAFSLLERPECNFFESSRTFTRPLYEDFRTLVIEGLIGTDMRHHHDQTKSVEGILADGQIEDNEVGKLLKAILHAADLSNPMKPFPIYMKWVDRVMAEFWQQGDEERRRGLPISILCDRNTTKVAKSQIGFISFVVKPFVRELAPVLPSVWLERLDLNAKALETVDPEEEQLRVRNITDLAAQPWRDVDPSTQASALLVIRNEISTMGSDEKVLQPAEFSSALDVVDDVNRDVPAAEDENNLLLNPVVLQQSTTDAAPNSNRTTSRGTTVEEDAAGQRGSVSSEESVTIGGRDRRSIVKLLDEGGPLVDGFQGSSSTSILASPLSGSQPHRAANRFGSRANLNHRVPSSPSLGSHVGSSYGGSGGGDAEVQLHVISMVQEVTSGYHAALQALSKSRGFAMTTIAHPSEGTTTLKTFVAWIRTLLTVERRRNEMRLQEQHRRRRGERRRRVSGGSGGTGNSSTYSSAGSPLSLFCAVMQHDVVEVEGDPCSLLGPDARALLLSAYQAATAFDNRGVAAGDTPRAAATYADMLQSQECVDRICTHVERDPKLLRSLLSSIAAYGAAPKANALGGSASTATTAATDTDTTLGARTVSSVSSRKRLFSLHSEQVTAAESTVATKADFKSQAPASPTTAPIDDQPLTLTLLASTMTASLLTAELNAATSTPPTNSSVVDGATSTPTISESHRSLAPVRHGAARASPVHAPSTISAAAPAPGASTPPATTGVKKLDNAGLRSSSHLASYTIAGAGVESAAFLFSRIGRLPLLDRSTESDPGGVLPLGETTTAMPSSATTTVWSNGRVGDVSAYRAKHRTLEAVPAPAWMREFLPSIRGSRGGPNNSAEF